MGAGGPGGWWEGKAATERERLRFLWALPRLQEMPHPGGLGSCPGHWGRGPPFRSPDSSFSLLQLPSMLPGYLVSGACTKWQGQGSLSVLAEQERKAGCKGGLVTSGG